MSARVKRRPKHSGIVEDVEPHLRLWFAVVKQAYYDAKHTKPTPARQEAREFLHAALPGDIKKRLDL